jgi:hypothetical protein
LRAKQLYRRGYAMRPSKRRMFPYLITSRELARVEGSYVNGRAKAGG